MKFKKYRLEEICSKIGDGIHGTPNYCEEGEYYFINGNNLVNGQIKIKQETKRIEKKEYEKHKRELNENTILISINGTLGNIAKFTGEKCILGKSACYLNVNQEHNSDFIKYICTTVEFKKYLINRANGTTIKNVPLSAIRSYIVKLPSLTNQNKITKILSSIDKKIDVNKEINENLQKLSQELYKHWFVDFDFPDENGKPYKSYGGKMVESELGEIPKDWEFERLDNIFAFVNGYAFKSNQYVSDGRYKIITIKNVLNGKIDTSTASLIKTIPTSVSKKCILDEGDILMSLTGNVGRVGIVTESDLLLNQRVAKILFDEKLNGFAYNYFTNEQTRNMIISLAKGTAQQNLSTIDLSQQKIPYSKEIAYEYSNIVNPFIEKIICCEKENRYLESLKKILLPKLMNGEIDLDKIEI